MAPILHLRGPRRPESLGSLRRLTSLPASQSASCRHCEPRWRPRRPASGPPSAGPPWTGKPTFADRTCCRQSAYCGPGPARLGADLPRASRRGEWSVHRDRFLLLCLPQSLVRLWVWQTDILSVCSLRSPPRLVSGLSAS